MRLIIAGGRNYALTPGDCNRLDLIKGVTEVVSGGASGADHGGELWAQCKRLQLTVMRADWHRHGRAAGPIRNKEMAKYADALALFPGGAGTRSMYREAYKAGLTIFDYRYPKSLTPGRPDTPPPPPVKPVA